MVRSRDIRINFLDLNLRSALYWLHDLEQVTLPFKLYMFSFRNEGEYLSCKLFAGGRGGNEITCVKGVANGRPIASILLRATPVWFHMQALQEEPEGRAGDACLPQGPCPGTCSLGHFRGEVHFRQMKSRRKSSPAGIQQAFTLDLRVKQRGNCLFIGMFLSPPFNVKPFHLLQSFRSQVSQNSETCS